MTGDTAEIKAWRDPEEVWVVAAVIMAGLILSPRQTDMCWADVRQVAVNQALLLLEACVLMCGEREEVGGDGEGRGVDSGSGGCAAPVV